jgi:hypothetical protein
VARMVATKRVMSAVALGVVFAVVLSTWELGRGKGEHQGDATYLTDRCPAHDVCVCVCVLCVCVYMCVCVCCVCVCVCACTCVWHACMCTVMCTCIHSCIYELSALPLA